MTDLNALGDALDKLEQLGPKLPPLIRNQIATLTKVLKDVVAAADLIEDLYRFLNGFDPSSVQARFHYEWRPELTSWPSGTARSSRSRRTAS